MNVRTVVPPAGGELSDEDLEHLYLPPPGRHVRANFVLSLDGAVEVNGRSGPLGTDDDFRLFATLRALADVVLVGAETVRREGYGPGVLSGPRRRRRMARGKGPQPRLAIVTASGNLDPGSRLFAGCGKPGYVPPLVFTGSALSAEHRKALSEVADVVVGEGRWVDLSEVLDELALQGHDWVLCEGGPTVLTELLHRRLVDELCLTHTAVVAGPGRAGLTNGLPLDQPIALGTDLLIAGDGALLGRYPVKSPAAPGPVPPRDRRSNHDDHS